MKLSDKAASINFDDLDDEPEESLAVKGAEASAPSPSSTSPQPARGRTTGVAAITEHITLHHQIQDLQGKLATLEKAEVVVKLDPRQIRESQWKNRHELSFQTASFAELKAEIEAAGGNVQPIKVRRAGTNADGAQEYEIVYGRRRRRACLELGFEVAAIVEDMDDVSLFKEMERENRSRQDLSPWEQGVMYKDALDKKLFASQRQLASELNLSVSTVSSAVALASLPQEIIDAFPSPLDLQVRWAAEINDALERDAARVLTSAQDLGTHKGSMSAKDVLAQLCGKKVAPHEALIRELKRGGQSVGRISRDKKGAVRIDLRAGSLSAAEERKLLDFFDRLIH